MLYLSYVDFRDRVLNLGVTKKIRGQIEAFHSLGENVYYTYIHNGVFFLCKDGTIIEKVVAFSRGEVLKYTILWIEKYCIDKVYTRLKMPLSVWTVDLFKYFSNNNISAVLEVASYPYDKEIRDEKMIVEDSLFWKEALNVVPLITTYSNMKKIHGISVISLQNGISIGDHPVRRIKKRKKIINLLHVASLYKWQGLERIIKGIAEYKEKGDDYRFILSIIGDGPALKVYKSMSKEMGLEEEVHFDGIKTGIELDKAYCEADIGIGALGLYKKDTWIGAPIKTREYCVRGLPFVYGYEDLGFSGDEEYCLKVPNNSTDIDMYKVIELYERTVERQDIVDRMRSYATQYFTWDTILKPVIDYYRNRKVSE